MRLMGFNLNKISAEKFSNKGEKINLKSNLNISSINKVDSDILKTQETLLGIDFIYNIDYNPEFAKLEFKGNILVSLDSNEAENVLKEWENKKMPDDFNVKLFNLILKKTNVKALELEDQMGLPFHISMPKVKKNSQNNS